MKKLLLITTLCGTLLPALELESKSMIRLAHIDYDYKSETNTNATALGGVLGLEAKSDYGITLGVAGYISQRLRPSKSERLNSDYLKSNGDSYIYLGELYLDYKYRDFSMRIGRQELLNPLLDGDDLRMHPNTFEAVELTYNLDDRALFSGGYAYRWSGRDAEFVGESKERFRKMDDENSKGVFYLGLSQKHTENLESAIWLYSADKMYDMFHSDIGYTIELPYDSSIKLLAEYVAMSERAKSGIDGVVYGVGAELSMGVFDFGAYYNHSSNRDEKTMSSGFGGMPYYVTMEELVIDGLNDVRATQLRAGTDLSIILLDGFYLTLLYGQMNSKPLDVKMREYDAIITADLADNIELELNYARVVDKNHNYILDEFNSSYNRFLARVTYRF